MLPIEVILNDYRSIQLPETWVCRIYSPSASPNTSILKRKVQVDVSPEPSSPVHRDKVLCCFFFM